MRVWRYNEVFLHGKKTGLDNFMAMNRGEIKRGFTVYSR